ncbi:MAG: VanZ family protein [Planctomycetes bacterium]|nr:VanZ family protein [Planctomycetota bacterium]
MRGSRIVPFGRQGGSSQGNKVATARWFQDCHFIAAQRSVPRMNERSLHHADGPFLLRYYVEILTGLVVLFVLQTGLVPFDFFEQRGQGPLGELFGTATARFNTRDIISNLLLYLPLGVFLHWTLCRRMSGRLVATVLTLLLAAGLSGGVEGLQAYSPSRVSSIIDLASNIIGAAAGTVLSVLMQQLLPRMFTAVLSELHEHPRTTLVKGYVCALLVVSAMPYSFSLDPGLLAKSVKEASWVPFASYANYETLADHALSAGDSWGYSLAKWQAMKHWSRWSLETLAFAVLVWLLYPPLRGYYGLGRVGAVALTLWICGGLAVGISAMQLLVVTRGMDVTDILFRGLGIAMGLGARVLGDRPTRVDHIGASAIYRRYGVQCGWVATLVYIIYLGVIPLTFSSDSGGLTRAVSSKEFLPFFGYSVTRFDLMIADVLEKFGAYALFAALLTSCWKRAQRLSARARVAGLAAIGVAIAAPLEVVQAFIPVRVTSLDDLILAGCGCAAGVVAQEYAVRFYRLTQSRPGSADKSPAYPDVPSPYYSSTDELLADLIDERPDAPVEPSPRRRPAPRS